MFAFPRALVKTGILNKRAGKDFCGLGESFIRQSYLDGHTGSDLPEGLTE